MVKTVIFDLGGVLIDWNPRYVYKNIFHSSEAIEHFLSHVCSSDWNELQDAGRSFADATVFLQNSFPEYYNEISTYYTNWEQMLGDEITNTVEALKKIKDSKKFRLLALTNWSSESFPMALTKFGFLRWFDDILVSGVEKLKKPDPKIFQLLVERNNIEVGTSLFIDDNIINIQQADNMGFITHHFQKPEVSAKHLLHFLKI